MSDRLYIDPLTNSVREERALFSFAKNLGLSFGSFFRLGVLTYARCLSESRKLPRTLEDDYRAVSSGDKDYLQRLLDERIEQDLSQSKLLQEAYAQDVPKVHSGPVEIDWDLIPRDLRLTTYVQMLMPEDFRAFWISKYNSADDDNRFDVLTEFAKDIICRHKDNPDKPFQLTDINDIRKVLRTWADSVRGFKS